MTSNENSTRVIHWAPESKPSWATTYKLTKLSSPPRGLKITDGEARAALKHMIVAVIIEEGPIHRRRLLDRIKSAFEVERAGVRIQEAIDAALKEAKTGSPRIREGKDFLWFEGSPPKVRFPHEGDLATKRSVEEVAPQELERAIYKTVHDALRIKREAAITYVARLYGWDRSGGKIEAAFAKAAKTLLSGGKVTADGEWLLPAPERDG